MWAYNCVEQRGQFEIFKEAEGNEPIKFRLWVWRKGLKRNFKYGEKL